MIFIVAAAMTLLPSLTLAKTWIVYRHGESTKNVQHIENGLLKNSDKYPLTENGKKFVRKTAAALRDQLGSRVSKIKDVYVSPFLRAQQTAEIVIGVLGISHSRLQIENLITEIS